MNEWKRTTPRVKKPKKTIDLLPPLRKVLRKLGVTGYIHEIHSMHGGIDYKAPHAPRGTPARPRSPFTPPFRLFKGHRP